MRILFALALALTLSGQGVALARNQPQTKPQPKPPATRPGATVTTMPPAPVVATEPGFTIGPEDVLGVLVWRDPELSGDVTVRADGMITLPLIRDVKAVGLTPNELAEMVQTAIREFITDASVTVVVRQMNSRRVFITGEVARPGAYPLASSMSVMQLIAIAGGLTEFAEANSISILRTEGGVRTSFRFPYKDVAKGKKPFNNILLKPGDTIVVPEK